MSPIDRRNVIAVRITSTTHVALRPSSVSEPMFAQWLTMGRLACGEGSASHRFADNSGIDASGQDERDVRIK
jgi:hypothetical protein